MEFYSTSSTRLREPPPSSLLHSRASEPPLSARELSLQMQITAYYIVEPAWPAKASAGELAAELTKRSRRLRLISDDVGPASWLVKLWRRPQSITHTSEPPKCLAFVGRARALLATGDFIAAAAAAVANKR